MARLNRPERDDLPESDRRYYDAVIAIRRANISGPFVVAMNSSPDLAARVGHLGGYFHDRDQADISILPSRVRTFAAILGARALDGVYEWTAWCHRALAAGLPTDLVELVRLGAPLPELEGTDRLVHQVVSELLADDHRLSQATYEEALVHFGPQGVVELVANLAYFAMIAFPLNAFEIEPGRPGEPRLPIEPTVR